MTVAAVLLAAAWSVVACGSDAPAPGARPAGRPGAKAAAPAHAAAAVRPPAESAAVGLEPEARRRELQLAELVLAQRMQRTVRELVALGPRMGGTPSGDRAAAYLRSAFEELGLAAEVVEDPAAPAHWEDGWSVELLPGGPLQTAYPYGFSPSSGPATAPLLQVADLAAEGPRPEWAGKVLYTPGAVGTAYRRIVASGHLPLAILTSSPNDPHRYRDASRIGALPALAANPIPVFAVSYDDGLRLAAAARGSSVVRVALRSTVRVGRPKTVVATLPGTERQSYYLICAHGDSDSGGPGADDNASGEATVLELARVLTQLRRDGRLGAPRITLRFAVWGAEYASSRAYAARAGDQLRRCLGVINFDETGTGAEREAIYFESNEVPWNRGLLRTLDRVGADYLGKPGFWPEYTTNPSQGGTDSYVFLPPRYQGELKSALEVPATTVYTAAWDHLATLRQTPGWETRGTPDPSQLEIDYSRYYHSSGDTPQNTTDRKPQAMVRAARAVGIALLRLAF
ncbi:MAG TPA: M28 family peptidase [Thermoanaerobaculia bacterium]|nr:M28 family peptidase [Thermoanaerobaculia bacterium]